MFETMTQEMNLRHFSPRMMETYVECNRDFYQWVQKNIHDVSEQDIRHYLLHLLGKQYASSTIDLIHTALRFYYGTVLRKTTFYPKRQQQMHFTGIKNNFRTTGIYEGITQAAASS